MDNENYSALVGFASRFRSACERYRDERPDAFASMKYFPRGCCTLASEAFLRYLRDEGIREAQLLNYMINRRTFSKHDIVIVGDWTIDLTGDQFDGEQRPIIIRPLADLPKAWKLLHKFTLDQLIAAHSEDGERTLLAMYHDISSLLSEEAREAA